MDTKYMLPYMYKAMAEKMLHKLNRFPAAQ